jgi:hypothetical protein
MAAMGVEFERLTQTILKSEGAVKVVLGNLEEALANPSTNPWVPKWYVWDIMAVVLHLILIVLI